MIKNNTYFGDEKLCYQWIYAKKTKEIVDKIKMLNTFLRNFQKQSNLLDKTKKFIDEILSLEKTNFKNVVGIFKKKIYLINSFENSKNDAKIIISNKENINWLDDLKRKFITKEYADSQGMLLFKLNFLILFLLFNSKIFLITLLLFF